MDKGFSHHPNLVSALKSMNQAKITVHWNHAIDFSVRNSAQLVINGHRNIAS